MATTSFLYHAQGLHGYRHIRTEYRGGCEAHHVELHARKRRCAGCGAPWWQLVLDGSFERTFLALPVGRRRQLIVLHGHRQLCKGCGRTLREPIPFTQGKERCTKRLARYIIDLCGILPIKQVGQLIGVGWDLVKGVYKRYLGKRLKKRKLGKVRYVAVDEFAVQKGHKYMTVVLDLETGAILHAHEGKDARALSVFLLRLRRARKRLRAVAMDMSSAYRRAVLDVFGDTVDVVHDPFHVVALASKAIDETRRDMVRSLEGEDRKVIKGSRFLLLRGLENLSENGLERLMLLMEMNEPLYAAYLLKEDLRMFWNVPDAEHGEAFLDQWTEQARGLDNKHFAKLADTLDDHRPGLLAWFSHRISTGPLEGLNNKIKVLKRQAYGFRDMEYFKLRLYFLHEAGLSLPG
jgi:transposase